MRKFIKVLLFLTLLIAGLQLARTAHSNEPITTPVTEEVKAEDYISEDITILNNAIQPNTKEQQEQAAKIFADEQRLQLANERVRLGRRYTATKFALGQCTDYVARKVAVTWRGNARNWIVNAKAQGYVVDRIPEKDAIIQTNESRYGHVGVIESVEGTLVTFSEWNYAGRFKETTRTLDISDSRIKGIIHLRK